MRRLSAVLVFVVALTAVTAQMYRTYAKKFFDFTGPAHWIWASHQISRNVPVVFFAACDFDLPPHRVYTRIKMIGDPEYTLYFNGAEVGGRRIGEARHLDHYDVSKLSRDGKNRILVAVRSANGVGGLLAGVDIAPEAENFVTTGEDWKIFRRWSPDLPLRDRGTPERPMLIGDPPTGRWNYLSLADGIPARPAERVIPPRSVESFVARVPTVRVVSGVAVAVAVPTRAAAFDFGPVAGRMRLTLSGTQAVPPLVRVRFANHPSELTAIEGEILPFAFGAGERTLLDPEVRQFRYAIVYGGRATADVVSEN